MKCLIIDDEKDAREFLRGMIRDYCPAIVSCEEADSMQTGLLAIENFQPDIVFLDIRMPKGSGFDLLKSLDKINFALIFTTAYDEYALKAFRYSALDYLLKPLDVKLLIQVVDKASKHFLQGCWENQIQHFMNHFDNKKKPPAKILLPSASDLKLVDLELVSHCMSEGNYTKVYFEDNSTFLVSKSIKSFEELLADYTFFRIHQSYLINVNHVIAYDKNLNKVELINQHKLSLARSKKKAFIELLESRGLRLS